jgi:hypothetical protein
VDLLGGLDPRFERALDPGVVQRAVLPGEVDPALRSNDVGLELGLLLGREEGEGRLRIRGSAGPQPDLSTDG